MPPGQYPQYPPPKQGMSSGAKIAIIIGCVVLGLMVLFGVFVGILAVAVTPKLTEARTKLELKQMEDLRSGLLNIVVDSSKRVKLAKDKQIKDTRGEEFWIAALENGVIDEQLAPRLTSLMSTNETSLRDYRTGDGIPSGMHVSFTAPKANEMMAVMNRRGTKRCVVITWNSRNWKNENGDRVPVVWSDEESPMWMTFEEAQRDWGITRAEWDDPRGHLFGKKEPFQFTFE